MCWHITVCDIGTVQVPEHLSLSLVSRPSMSVALQSLTLKWTFYKDISLTGLTGGEGLLSISTPGILVDSLLFLIFASCQEFQKLPLWCLLLLHSTFGHAGYESQTSTLHSSTKIVH